MNLTQRRQISKYLYFIILLSVLSTLMVSFDKDEINNFKYNINSYKCCIRNTIDTTNKDSLKLNQYAIIVIDDFELPPRKVNENQMKYLIECFKDTNKDFAANLILYHLTQVNASNYIVRFNSIDEWRLKYKSQEIIFWENRFKK